MAELLFILQNLFCEYTDDPILNVILQVCLNKVESYYGHRLFLWMPRHLFKYHFKCPHTGCAGSLVNAGVHQKTRIVLDVHDYYIIAGEDYECNKCKKKFVFHMDPET